MRRKLKRKVFPRPQSATKQEMTRLAHPVLLPSSQKTVRRAPLLASQIQLAWMRKTWPSFSDWLASTRLPSSNLQMLHLVPSLLNSLLLALLVRVEL